MIIGGPSVAVILTLDGHGTIVEIMAGYRTGDKLLFAPMMA